MTVNLRTALTMLDGGQFLAGGNQYLLGTLFTVAMYQASEPLGKRDLMQKALVASYDDDSASNPGLKQLIESNLNTSANFTPEAVVERDRRPHHRPRAVEGLLRRGGQPAAAGLRRQQHPGERLSLRDAAPLRRHADPSHHLPHPMSARTCQGLMLFALLVAPLAHAQRSRDDQEGGDDAPIPYSDDNNSDDDERRKLPDKSRPAPDVPEETEVEQQDRERPLVAIDDPSIGIGLEAVMGALLLESSKGAGVEPRFIGGFRFTWEWTRTLLSDEFTRELSFVDVTWQYTNWADGTREVHGSSDYHYFTLAPAIAWPLGKSTLSLYGQVGIGFNYNPSSITIDDTTTSLSGTKFVLQYGLGIRGRPLVYKWDTETGKQGIRISFRAELTRFRRQYMDDTMIGGSVGITF